MGVVYLVNRLPSSLPSGTTETAGEARPGRLALIFRMAIGAGSGVGENASACRMGEGCCPSSIIGEGSWVEDLREGDPDDLRELKVLASQLRFLVLSSVAGGGASSRAGSGSA